MLRLERLQKRLLATAPILLTLLAGQSFAAEYKVDPAHSKIGFSVRHLMISKVRGDFKKFEGTFNFDADKGTVSNAKFEAKADSVDTGEPKRDEHLRSADFFDVKKYPNLTLTNSKITKTTKGHYKWTADLTIHGVTKPVTFDLEHLGSTKDPWGMNRVGFTATATINRKDFGLNWNKALETGGVVVGEEVEIQLDAEAIEAKAATAEGEKSADKKEDKKKK